MRAAIKLTWNERPPSDEEIAANPATRNWDYGEQWIDAKPRFETWAYPLVVGQRLPTLPLWLTEDFAVSLDLEASYEDACRALKIP